MNPKTLLSLAIALMVVAGGASAAVAGADGDLEVAVAQNDATGEVTVEVTENETPVETASVNVTVDDENVSYDGAGDYETDEDGAVVLPAPDEEVNVTITADYENETATVSTTLEAAPGFQLSVDQDPGETAIVSVTDNGSAVENASVNVTVDDENATYDGVGDYETDADGTVELPAPNETVTVDVTATDDDRTAWTTATLQAHDIDPTLPFGQQLQQYMDTIEDDEHPFGHHVANWVTKHNPGNAPAHAGPPEHAGPPDHAGPGADGDAGNETDRESGPPDHAGPGSDGDNGDDDERGPPDHAGPGAEDGDVDADDDDEDGDDE